MAKFLVTGRQTVVVEVEVEATSEEEALKLAAEQYECVEEYEVNNTRVIPQDDLEWEWVDPEETPVIDVKPEDVIPVEDMKIYAVHPDGKKERVYLPDNDTDK